MRMPFGKFKGRPIVELPSSYLVWVIEECANISPHLGATIRATLAGRFGARQYHLSGCAKCERAMAAVGAWFRRWALVLHPDRGGSDQSMAALNSAREELERALS